MFVVCVSEITFYLLYVKTYITIIGLFNIIAASLHIIVDKEIMRTWPLFLAIVAVLLEQNQILGEQCTINCFYFPSESLRVLKCQPSTLPVPDETHLVHCEVKPMNGKLILYVGYREFIHSIEPADWSLPSPESNAVVHLDLDFHISKVDANTFSKAFPKLKSLVIYQVDSLSTDAFAALNDLQELRITKQSDKLYGNPLLFVQNSAYQGLVLNYKTTCFKCSPNVSKKTAYFVEFHKSSYEMSAKKLLSDDCPVLPLKEQCQLDLQDPLPSLLTTTVPHATDEDQLSPIDKKQVENRSYATLILLLCISIATTVVTVISVIVIIAVVEKMRSKSTFTEKYAKDVLIVDNGEDKI